MLEPSIAAQVADLIGDDLADARHGGSQAARLARTSRAPKRLPVQQALQQCPREALLAAEDQGRPVAVAVLADGSTVVLPDHCPHDGGLLSDGFIEGNRIVCARHGWEFDGHSGRCAHRPELRVPCSLLAEGSGPVDS